MGGGGGGGGRLFSGGGSRKYILPCKGGHYMKNKNMGGGCQLNLISKKGPNAKMRKKMQRIIKH